MALTGIKFDDGTGGYATNCFRVRPLVQHSEEASGAWIVAQRAEQRRRFKAFICSKPCTYEEIRNERKKAERNNTAIIPPYHRADEEEEDENKLLDGFFLMKHCCVEDPSDLCSVNISGQGLSEVKEEDLQLFDNVAYVNASENILPLEPFKGFPVIRELELSLNGLRGIKVQPSDFINLEMLDLSYNNLAPEDVLPLGLIPNLKVLHLTGNSFRTLPADMARPHLDEQTFERVARFIQLEILLLDDNKLSDPSVFAVLAGLRKLKHLNLSKNQICSVPQLLLIEGEHVTQDTGRKRRTGQHSRRSSRRSKKSERNQQTKSTQSNTNEIAESELTNAGKSTTVEPSPKEGVSNDFVLRASVSGEGKSRPNVLSSDTVKEEEKTDELMEDLGTLSELKLEEVDLEAMSRSIMESLPGSEPRTYAKGGFQQNVGSDMPPPPPFPELQHLNLAYNRIPDEESLLAVAAWPMLSELIIHDNPLTTENSGDPPILKHFLKDRLGVTIQRKKEKTLPKPHIEIPIKPERKVTSKILPVPRCNVDELLALEAPKPSPPAAFLESEDKMDKKASLDGTQPLPPIPSSARTNSPELENQSAEAAFFMTQVDEPGTDKQNIAEETQWTTNSVKESPKKTKKKGKNIDLKKYKGFEALFDEDDNGTDKIDDLPITKDVAANVRALQYALSHPLVYRDNPKDLQVPQPPVRTVHKGLRVPPSKPRKTKAEQIDEALRHLKTRSTVVEMNLEEVLSKKEVNKKEYDEAKQLLGRVQHRYNAVRATSMQKANHLQQSQDSLKGTLKNVQHQLSQMTKTTA